MNKKLEKVIGCTFDQDKLAYMPINSTLSFLAKIIKEDDLISIPYECNNDSILDTAIIFMETAGDRWYIMHDGEYLCIMEHENFESLFYGRLRIIHKYAISSKKLDNIIESLDEEDSELDAANIINMI